MDNFLYKIYNRVSKNKVISLLLLLLLLGGLSFLVSKIGFEEDISKLIPVNDKNKEYQKVLKTVNFTDKIIVNIQSKTASSEKELLMYANQFLDSIQQYKGTYIKNIQGKVSDNDISGTMDFVYNNLPLFLNKEDYVTIAQKLQNDSLKKITEQNYRTLISPSGIIARKTILKDPLGLSFMALKKLQQLGFGDDFVLKDGFLLSKNKQNILLFITPQLSSNETAENAAFADSLYTIQNTLNTAYDGKVKSEYFGAALIAVANAKQIKHDIQFTVGIALTLLLIILIFFYKRITIPIILFTPTVFGALLSVAFLYLFRGKISAISLGIGSVLLGVTLDYALHILTHIRGLKSIKSLYTHVAPSILMSSITTASAFLCLLFLDSQALQDLGIFAAISVLGSSVFALLFIPQVYVQKTQKKTAKNTIIDRFAAYNFHKSKWGIAVIAVTIIISLFTYNKVIFNKDLAKMNYEPQHFKDARERLDALTNIESKSVYLATYGNQLEDALQNNDQHYQKLQQLEANGNVKSFSSIGSLVSSQKAQNQKINAWKTFWSSEKITQTKNRLIQNGSELGFKPKTFSKFYQLLDTNFKPLSLKDYEALQSFTIEDYIVSKNDFTTVTSLIKVDSAHVKLIENSFKNENNTVLIDRQAMNETFLGNLKNDFNSLINYSVIAVLILLLVFYRSLSLTLVTSIPIFLTWLLTVGIMGLFKIEFNIFNIIISTFIFGLGVDYSIFVTNGLLTEYRTGEKTLPTHKTSIILSVITTILGVGVLIFAKHPALYTISLVSLIGILCAVLIAFTIQPLLFKLFIGSKTKRPISLRLLVHSVLSSTYYALGCILFALISTILIKIVPISKKTKMAWYHKACSKFLKSVIYSNPFVKKSIINEPKETFEKPAVIIANHTSGLDSLTMGMLYPKIIFLVNSWVYNSPVFKMAAQLAEFYPVDAGIEDGVAHLKKKVAQGYSIMVFPEGTRSTSNKIKRFHKGAFFLAEQLNLDILPILIHGNSEVQPKGDFTIRNGSITVKIMDCILASDQNFGNDARERTKKISAFFKTKFAEIRNEIEHETYFFDMILDDFRYKGDTIYKAVQEDLRKHKSPYHQLTKLIGKKESILHLSEDAGQLDFLLTLDSVDRKINTYIENPEEQIVFANSYITHNYGKITPVNSLENITSAGGTLIYNLKSEIPEELLNNVKNIVLLKSGKQVNVQNLKALGFNVTSENDTFSMLKKVPNT